MGLQRVDVRFVFGLSVEKMGDGLRCFDVIELKNEMIIFINKKKTIILNKLLKPNNLNMQCNKLADSIKL